MKIQVKKDPVNADLRKLIAEKAYQLFLTRQARGLAGDKDSDWIQAEKEIMKMENTQSRGFRKVS
jgi:hypothetical protein